MYQALYRKYRPKTLEEIGGQDTIVKIIRNSIEQKHINHAYLFAGPRGTGKTSIAKVFAKMVNCENLENGIPCGKCISCMQTNNSDIIEIDAASNNGVDEIRELRNKVNLVPSYGKYKVYIIDEVHMLTPGAFNALLKTLEEPPAHIIFILATTDPHKIPETILSRCQRLDFKKISDESIIKRLSEISKKENIDIEEEALKEIARLSDGGMRDSIGMLDQAIAYSDGKITVKDIHDINGTLTAKDLSELITSIINSNIKDVLIKLDNYNVKGKNFVKLTEEIITFMRNILLYKNASDYFKTINNNVDLYEEISKNVSTKKILEYIQILNNSLLEMKTTNNPRLILELAIIQMLDTKKEDKEESETIPVHFEIKKEEVSSNKELEKTKEVPISNKKLETTKEMPIPNKEIEKAKEIPKKENKELERKIEEIKQIRINNTLAKFSKKHMQEIKQAIEKFNNYLLDSDISSYASIILDGTLKAASDTNLIFVYNNARTANLFNENIIEIEKAIEKVLTENYKVIATDTVHWEKIKQEFNGKKKEYKYIEEDFDIADILNTNSTNSELTEFQDIIEYN